MKYIVKSIGLSKAINLSKHIKEDLVNKQFKHKIINLLWLLLLV
jgi:hypothetical protein